MTNEEYEEIAEIWRDIRNSVTSLMQTKLNAQSLSADQIQFVYEKCTEDLYHAGWNAMENIIPGR